MKRNILPLIIITFGIICIPDASYCVVCPTTNMTQQIENGEKLITYCRTCASVPTGCPCAVYCEYLQSARCNCNSGYHSEKITGSFIHNDCKCVVNPKCPAGQYGDGTNCTACPSPGTSASGATNITDCYVSSGVNMTDSTGTYQFTSKCSYTK